MEIFSSPCLLVRRFVLCCVAMLSVNAVPSYAWPFSSVKSSCTVPAGLYKARQLGAGFDALDIAVNSLGEVQGSYRLSTDAHVHQSPVLYEVWLDSKTSNISCHGNTIDISTSDSAHSLDLSLVWNRSLLELQVSGSYVGDPSWARWTVKNGVWLASSAALISTVIFLYKHQHEIQLISEVFAGQLDTVSAINAAREASWSGIRNIGFYTNIFRYAAAQNLQKVVTSYSSHYLHNFTAPLIGGMAGGVTSLFISNRSTYPLGGSGRLSLPGYKEESCTIPSGVYFGEVNGSISVTIPVSESEGKDQSGRVSASSGETTTYDIEPSKFVCQGNEIILKWDKSLPASKGAMSAFYDEEKGVLMGTGYFARSGWVSYSNPIPLPSVQFMKEQQR